MVGALVEAGPLDVLEPGILGRQLPPGVVRPPAPSRPRSAGPWCATWSRRVDGLLDQREQLGLGVRAPPAQHRVAVGRRRGYESVMVLATAWVRGPAASRPGPGWRRRSPTSVRRSGGKQPGLKAARVDLRTAGISSAGSIRMGRLARRDERRQHRGDDDQGQQEAAPGLTCTKYPVCYAPVHHWFLLLKTTCGAG